jgi:hypothetical protein
MHTCKLCGKIMYDDKVKEHECKKISKEIRANCKKGTTVENGKTKYSRED